MTDKQKRKAALADYRERKVESGILALRCRKDDGVWVGHGADSIAFEVLEVFDPEELGLGLEREMKGRHADWVERLGAVRI